jgi:hypothetical protein
MTDEAALLGLEKVYEEPDTGQVRNHGFQRKDRCKYPPGRRTLTGMYLSKGSCSPSASVTLGRQTAKSWPGILAHGQFATCRENALLKWKK